jgi:hypothetical protein
MADMLAPGAESSTQMPQGKCQNNFDNGGGMGEHDAQSSDDGT